MVKYLQGKYKPKNPQKYKGNPNNIIYRSSWERIMLVKFDTNPNVLEYSSEEIIIPYRSPATGRVHRYFPDFYVKIRNVEGGIDNILIEIKPQAQVDPPKPPQRTTPAFLRKALLWEVNNAKWEAARKWCDAHGYAFKIITEKGISRFKK